MRWSMLAAAVVCVSAVTAMCSPTAWATDAAVREASTPLARPDGAPQPNAHGACDIRTGGDFERFRIVVEGVNAEVPLRVFLGDGHETLNQVGEMPAGSAVRTFLRTTLEGGELPYGVESARDLAERRIEIRDGEQRVVLRGNVPVVADPPVEEPPPPADEPVVTRSTMHRTDENGEREPRGTLVATRRSDGSSLRLEVGRLAPETGYLVYLWAEQTLVLWDDFRTNREGGGSLAGDTAEGPGLPLHAESVVALAGRRVEVRDRDGHLLLYGEVPAAESSNDAEPVREETAHEDAETGADVQVEVRIDPERGHEEVRIVARDLPRGDAAAKRRRFADVRLDDGTGEMQTVATVRVRGGRARVRFTSRRGAELPLGVESVRDLFGRAYEFASGGSRLAGGTIPIF